MSASEATCMVISACSRWLRLSMVSRSEGSAQRDGQAVVVLVDGHDAVLPGDVPRDGRDDVVVDLDLGEVDDFGAEVGGLGLGDIGGADDLVGDHQVHHAHPGGLGFVRGLRHLVGGDKAEVHQDIDQIIVFFSHGSFSHYSRSSREARPTE